MVFTGKESLQKEEKKKLAQIKPQKYLSSLKELSEKVTEGEVWFQALQVGVCCAFGTLFFSGSGDLDRC